MPLTKNKIANKMNFVLASLEVQEADPEAIAVVLDVEGNLNCIALGGNLLFVSKGRIHMPNRWNTINGMSQAIVLELADQ